MRSEEKTCKRTIYKRAQKSLQTYLTSQLQLQSQESLIQEKPMKADDSGEEFIKISLDKNKNRSG